MIVKTTAALPCLPHERDTASAMKNQGADEAEGGTEAVGCGGQATAG